MVVTHGLRTPKKPQRAAPTGATLCVLFRFFQNGGLLEILFQVSKLLLKLFQTLFT